MASTTLRGGLQPRWAVRASTFLIWTLALFSAAHWALRMAATPTGDLVAPPVQRPAPVASPAAVAKLLGASPQAPTAASPSLASRFVLTGVVANALGGGAALLAVDGRPPKPFRVGGRIDDNLIVQAVDGRRVMLGAEMGGPHLLVLDLPPLQK